MHFQTLLVAAAGLISSAMAAPTAEAAAKYQWDVAKWSFSRGESSYDYSFNITGAKNGETPAFTAQCSGTAPSTTYAPCKASPKKGLAVSAYVNIVQDPRNKNDNIPEVFVETVYTDAQGCRYNSTGHHYSRKNIGDNNKFNINVQDTAVC